MTDVREHSSPTPTVDFVPNPLLPADSVQCTANGALGVQKVTLKLTNAVLTITDAAAYGSIKLGNLPDRNYLCIGAEADLSCVKDGTGIVTGELPKLAVGTAAASNATLSSTMINILNGGAGGTALASGLTATYKVHSNDNVTAIPYLGIGDSPTLSLYLNGGVNPTGDGYLTITGYIDLYLIDIGNRTS